MNKEKYIFLIGLVLAITTSVNSYEDKQNQGLVQDETRNIRPRNFQNPQATSVQGGFRQVNEDNIHSPAQHQQLRRPALFPQELEYQNSIPIQHKPVIQKKPLSKQAIKELEEEEELEKEEPDRLSELLPNSDFDCVGRNTGYYADEGLACEVFHYCQDDVKHSWICPDGFTFHQVHLICMPPSTDNICKKSSQYHFVNDYLYKPLNAEEAQRRPNVTLKYSDRFYPAEVYQDTRYDEDDDEEPERVQIVAAPRRPAARPPVSAPAPTPIPLRRPQVFRAPEEVDIRRPPHFPQPFHPSNNQEFDYERK